MDKTPDVAQLSICCGKRLVWASTATESGEVNGWGGRCPGCGTEWAELATPARILLSTEQMLLARIAELEATLANERGEGEPPVKGWRWIHVEWSNHTTDLMHTFREGDVWIWERLVLGGIVVRKGTAATARDAMRAASSQGADVPKEA